MVVILVFLFAIVLVMVTTGTGYPSGNDGWNLTNSGPVAKIFVADDGTIYLFGGECGNTIYAMDSGGNKKWELEVPDQWRVSKKVFAADRGVIYLYLYAFDIMRASQYDDVAFFEAALEGSQVIEGRRGIMAVSDKGKILWCTEVPDSTGGYGSWSVYACGGHAYYYFNNSVMVLDRYGRAQFNITDIHGPPTVDEHGNIYVVKESFDSHGGHGSGSIIEAYYPDGSLYWRQDLDSTIYSMINYGKITPFNSVLLYQDDLLYAWVNNGTVKLSTNGSIIRSKTFPYNGCEPLEAMPIDSQGNLYYLFHAYPPYIDIVTPDGREILREVTAHNATFPGLADGSIYFVDYSFNGTTVDRVEKGDLMSASISAYNVLEDRYLWNLTFAPGASEITIAGDGAEVLQSELGTSLGNWDTIKQSIILRGRHDADSDEQVMIMQSKGLVCNWGIHMAQGTDTLYLDYYSFNWQKPIINNQTACIYANSLYAIADNGTLLWVKPLGSLVTSMAVNNSTLYYGTVNGGFYVENAAKIGGGLALLAIVYLIARFFVIGSIARARSRLDKNENRNSLMQYIADNPGLTARDIARGLGVNLGTIRYHLLILGLNHKIITYNEGRKHVRYFKNSGSYSQDEQLVLSLIRRDGMRKVLKLLADKRRLSNQDLSRDLGMRESAVSRYMKELVADGIVTREPAGGGNIAYSIREDRIGPIELALKRIGP